MCIMKTIFVLILIFVVGGNTLLGKDIEKGQKNIEIAVATFPTPQPRPKSIRPQTITAYYSIGGASVVVEFKTNQGTGLVELKDNVGNVVEAQTVDTSIQSVLTLPLPTQPGECTLLINTDALVGVGHFIIK